MLVSRYKDVNYAAAYIQQACVCLRAHWGIWITCLVLQILHWWVLFLFIWSQAAQNYLPQDPYGIHKRLLSSFMMAWTIFFLKQGKALITAVSTISWYFPHNRQDPEAPKHPAIGGLMWTFSYSLGTLSFGSVLRALYECVNFCGSSGSESTGSVPCSLHRVLTNCIGKWITLATKFTMVAHALSSHAFCRSGKEASFVMSGRFLHLIVVQETGESVVRVISYFMALLIGFTAWIWCDVSEDQFDTLSAAGWNSDGWFLFFVALFVLLTYFPITTLLTICALSSLFETWWTPILFGLFVGSVAHLLFEFMSEVMMDSVNAITFCYALEKTICQTRMLPGGDSKISGPEAGEFIKFADAATIAP
mmetsp:Transcript_5187/g.9535  ORF Transcript_5187/g.9535 Transcript_5187/m.9535 type:complete len:363 (+) Transcript_5187:626-1714(+)